MTLWSWHRPWGGAFKFLKRSRRLHSRPWAFPLNSHLQKSAQRPSWSPEAAKTQNKDMSSIEPPLTLVSRRLYLYIHPFFGPVKCMIPPVYERPNHLCHSHKVTHQQQNQSVIPVMHWHTSLMLHELFQNLYASLAEMVNVFQVFL